MTDGAATAIPELLAEQVLSLAHRGGGQTVLAASGAREAAQDRLVVVLQPPLKQRDREGKDSESLCMGRVRDRDDDRPRYALVISCSPGQVRESSLDRR